MPQRRMLTFVHGYSRRVWYCGWVARLMMPFVVPLSTTSLGGASALATRFNRIQSPTPFIAVPD
ncbi:hypothetical protein BCR33DRAFT_710855 [Rhizoclosmatium globosum]|uniref:Uncharacterized protein n=1 Tax=Rhizoclosmatium globosum TaxID=329046 RepID=A0A1Y2D2A1_9FUNG|nr:hypothetical protein BCR33DRAFT_710855 [Rhizoclosmatium globosum]|eukprot:ORY53419.1 hypothetical protein BCR33DRAFT_710855 [Rhizoclosmatium globosum]